jgi:hypothetical protein
MFLHSSLGQGGWRWSAGSCSQLRQSDWDQRQSGRRELFQPDGEYRRVAFTLKTFIGTAPTLLNNTVTSGQGSFEGDIGYEEYFTFGSSYDYYRILPRPRSSS